METPSPQKIVTMPDRSNPVLDRLVEGWIGNFWSADHQLKWTDAETEVAVWLDPLTLLGGRIDARGLNYENAKFFADWKTKNPKWKKNWKAAWRKSIQTLTYGVLLYEVDPLARLFLVRMAFKDNTYDQEWFQYDEGELTFWRGQLIEVAKEIRAWRMAHPNGPWAPNYDYCFRYGVAYQCPNFQNGCDKLRFNDKTGLVDRVSHLQVERDARESFRQEGFVFLDATRTEEWYGCHEKYRKEYEENLRAEPGEALTFGHDFHKLLDVYYKKLIGGKL